MARYEDDGTVSRSRGEHYNVEGSVWARVFVSFDTKYEPDSDDFRYDLSEAVTDAIDNGDWEFDDYSGLTFTIEKDD